LIIQKEVKKIQHDLTGNSEAVIARNIAKAALTGNSETGIFNPEKIGFISCALLDIS